MRCSWVLQSLFKDDGSQAHKRRYIWYLQTCHLGVLCAKLVLRQLAQKRPEDQDTPRALLVVFRLRLAAQQATFSAATRLFAVCCAR